MMSGEGAMLKECYYLDQSDFDSVDYVYLHRFIDRMIQYRNSCKGSYDGNKRIDEIKRIDLDRMSYNTKLIFLYCIHKHGADELLTLPNLKGLNELEYKDIGFLERENQVKLRVEDFYNNIKELNARIGEFVNKGDLPEDYVLMIKCIGGFAMSYWRLREGGMTEDMYSLIEIDEAVKKLIVQIAVEHELPYDWVNDTMLHFYDSSDRYRWVEVPWYFGKESRVRVYVCSKEDLLKNKIGFAEKYLEGRSDQDRDAEIDYKDTLSLLNDMGINKGTNSGYARVRLEMFGIYVKDYPLLFASVLDTDHMDDEDYMIFKMIADVEKGKKHYEDFRELIGRLGYSSDDIRSFYSMYLDTFPVFSAVLNKK